MIEGTSEGEFRMREEAFAKEVPGAADASGRGEGGCRKSSEREAMKFTKMQSTNTNPVIYATLKP
ncbi:hypothetical protein Hanom_Chr07g00628681 [Helianthus anomalus]